jgi:endoplasmic reticulum junction formation protein lunapark
LSSQITAATQSLETTKSRARRIQALWTLYTTVTYLLYTLIIALVLGPQKWAIPHYAGLAGAPLVIYAVRRAIQVFFDWRISQQQAYIEALQKQRDAKIAELKKATKYDSTQELLQKYGGAGKPAPSKSNQQSHPQTQQGTKRKITPTHEPQRTGLPPPPTANIPGRTIGSASSTPLKQNVDTTSTVSAKARSPLLASVLIDSPATITPDEPGFAPNAFPNPPQQARPAYEQPSKWYDRILDVLLGEDETLAKNRIVLICANCRLVNGQAPPGVKSLEEVGRWKCGGCGAWNGVESEAANLMQEMRQKVQNEQIEGGESIAKGHKKEATPPLVDGGPELDLHKTDDVQKPAREIPDSEDDTEDEDIRSEDRKDDGDEDIKLDDKRVTRSRKKRSAKRK